MVTDNQRFALRSNPDNSFDSICLHCFRTVATSSTLSELHAIERNHECDRDMTQEMQDDFIPSPGAPIRRM